MNLPGLWQLETKVLFVKGGQKTSLQIPWKFQDSVETGILNLMLCPQPALAAELSAASLAEPFPVTPRLSFPGIHFVVSSFVTRAGHQENKPNRALQNTRPVHRHHTWSQQFTSLISVCSGFGFFSHWTPREADLTIRNQFRTRSCPPRQLVASTILSRGCAEDRPGCQKIFNPFFSHTLYTIWDSSWLGCSLEVHSSWMAWNDVHLKQIFSSHLWGCLGNTPMFPVRNSSCSPQKELSGLREQTRAPSQIPAVPWEQAAARGRAKAPQMHLNILTGIISALRWCLGVTGRYFPVFCQQTDFWHLFLHWDVPILLSRFVYTQSIKMFKAPGVSMEGTKKWKSKAIWSLDHLNWEEIGAENLARVNSELILSSENGIIIPKLPFIIKKMQQMNQISSSNTINLNARVWASLKEMVVIRLMASAFSSWLAKSPRKWKKKQAAI